MERDAHYIAVGSFIILTVVLTLLFVIWLSESKSRADVERYEIRFEGSVTGLSTGESVRFLGVKVGRVVDIDLIPEQPELVSVLVDIEEWAPIDSTTVAALKLQGITGVAYIELEKGEGEVTSLERQAEERYPIIASRKSNIEQLFQALPMLLAEIREVVERANTLLNDGNIISVTTSLENIEHFSAHLTQLADKLNLTLGTVTTTMNSYNRLAVEVRPDALVVLDELKITAHQLARTSQIIADFIERNSEGISEAVSSGLQEFQSLLKSTNKAVAQIEGLANSLQQDPSRLLYQPAYQGVKIKP